VRGIKGEGHDINKSKASYLWVSPVRPLCLT